MSDQIAIAVRAVSKAYRIWNSPASRLLSPAWSTASGLLPENSPVARKLQTKATSHYRDFWALKEISFEIKKGESIGIIGRNGSGKSTLLQIIAGTLQPTSGSVTVNGRVAALLELGSGFNPEFTGRENVHLNAAVLGLSRAEVDACFDQIAAFADIGEFMDQPIKTYSSGMMVRLAFAVATSVKPDILIVDEALSVGDVFFQQKCFKRIHSLLDQGVSLLFVSHDTAAVQNLCNRGILLHKASVVHEGKPEECTSRYYALDGDKAASTTANMASDRNTTLARTPQEIKAASILSLTHTRHGAGGMRFVAAMFINEKGEAIPEIEMGKTCQVHAILLAHADINEPAVGVRLYDRMNNLVFAAGNRQLQMALPALRSGDELHVQFELTLSVNPGHFTVTLDCSEPSTEGPNNGIFHDVVEGLGPLHIHFDRNAMWPFYGIAQLPLKLFYSRCAAQLAPPLR